MTTKTKLRLEKLRAHYKKYEDNDTLSLFDEKESEYNEGRNIKIFRENPKTQELIKVCYGRLKVAYNKLTTQIEMSDAERRAYLISIDWAKWFLDQFGEDEKAVDKAFDDLIEGYVIKAGLE